MITRAERLYEIAISYVNLSPMARYLVATHFQLVAPNEFHDETLDVDVTIFKRVIERNIYDEFTKLTKAFEQSNSFPRP